MAEHLPAGEPQENAGFTNYADLYQQAHPLAEPDIRKAEYMAHAGNVAETEVVESRKAALDHASKIFDDDDGSDHHVLMDVHIEAAQDARIKADLQEQLVGDAYDRTKDL